MGPNPSSPFQGCPRWRFVWLTAIPFMDPAWRWNLLCPAKQDLTGRTFDRSVNQEAGLCVKCRIGLSGRRCSDIKVCLLNTFGGRSMVSPCISYRRMRPVTVAGTALVVLMVLVGCGVGTSGSTARPSASGLGAERVSATIDQSGGRLANQAGVVLEVPKNVLKAPATVSITPEPNGAWDVHIAAVWSGTVAVTLPIGNDADGALLGHQVNGTWRVESTKESHGALTAYVKSLSWFKVLGCLLGTPNAGRIARCMIDAGIRSLALKGLTGSLAKKLLNIFAPQCTGLDVIDGIIDFEKQKLLGIAPSECTAVDGAPSSGDTAASGTGSDNHMPLGQPTQPSATVEQLTVTLTENPFRCDGGTRILGYVSGAVPGEQVTFRSPQLGSLRAANAGRDGRISLTWECQPSDAGTKWQVIGRGANGTTVSFTVTGAPAATPSNSSSGQQVYWHHVYHTCANGKCGLRLHTGPGYSAYPVTRVLVDGDAVGIVCQAHGEPVSGIDGSSSDVWDRLIDGDWAADFYVDTPGTTGSFSPPIPVC